MTDVHLAPAAGTTARQRHNFRDLARRDEHIRAFRAWLAPVLHTAPGIAWDRLPSRVMGHLLATVADSPDAVPIALAIGCAAEGQNHNSLLHNCQALFGLLRRLRLQHGVRDLAELRDRRTWERFIADRQPMPYEVRGLIAYDGLAGKHLALWLESLDERERQAWRPYALPPLPTGFLERSGLRRELQVAAQRRRKAQSDVLVPLFPLLVELAQFRKQAAERLVRAFRRERARVRAGEVALPHAFLHRERLRAVREDARLLAEVTLEEREVVLPLVLWDRVSWARAHPERYCAELHRRVARGVEAYAPEANALFLQYEGPPEDLLWFGDILAHGALGRVKSSPARQARARALGEPRGFWTSRAGLLNPSSSASNWFQAATVEGETVFEPESLYRGVLYGAALATLALTNASRVSELLQVSAARFERIAVDEIKGGRRTGGRSEIVVQSLLPKGCRRDGERQLFLIAEPAVILLREIWQALAAAHGGDIPVVQPAENHKAEHLHPEPYFFQWAAGPDGRLGLLRPTDVATLLRFLFHGLRLATRDGTPIRIGTHLLRHGLAEHARHHRAVPAEALAYLLHHHVPRDTDARHPATPAATAYYSRMPLEQSLALLHELQIALATQRAPTALAAPAPDDLAGLEAPLRAVFAEWGTIGPTAFGFCGAGLCVRPGQRALCLGCGYHVPHHANLAKAREWRTLYALQAERHEADGHHVDAGQARRALQDLDDMLAVMRIQRQAREDGGWLPLADTLLAGRGAQEDGDG